MNAPALSRAPHHQRRGRGRPRSSTRHRPAAVVILRALSEMGSGKIAEIAKATDLSETITGIALRELLNAEQVTRIQVDAPAGYGQRPWVWRVAVAEGSAK